MINAGMLKERFAFDRRQSVQDGYGNEQGAWAEQYNCRARRQPLNGGEGVMAGRLQGRQTVLLYIRYSTAAKAISTEFRARDMLTGEVFNIREAKATEDRRFVELLCEKGVADG